MSNLKRTYAEIISQAQVMATGLKANQAEVARRGIDTGFVTELEKTRLEAIALNDEQEKLKSALKIKTVFSSAVQAAIGELFVSLPHRCKYLRYVRTSQRLLPADTPLYRRGAKGCR